LECVASSAVLPDPEVVENAGRRRFTAKYKLGVLDAAERCQPREIGALLRKRWHVELDLRGSKTTLGMEHLRCKTPQMARKELCVYLLADNLIRLLMARAALLADQIRRQLSFKHSVQV